MLEGVCNTKKMGKGAGHACVGVLGQGKSINTQYRKDVMKEGGGQQRGERSKKGVAENGNQREIKTGSYYMCNNKLLSNPT